MRAGIFNLYPCLCNLFSLVDSQTTSANPSPTSILDLGGDIVPTGSQVSYISYNSTIAQIGAVTDISSTFAIANASASSSNSIHTSSSRSASIIRGSHSSNGSRILNNTASRTISSSAQPVNTQPCNNYPDFCDRKYSNVTYVAAHNSPFVVPNNVASNQLLGVTDQLNDGVRMIQGQVHYNSISELLSYCHTSCDLLNAGTAESIFREVYGWVRRHPFDILTILIGNSDFVDVDKFTGPLKRSGLSRYAYIPSQIPMSLSAWPTLGEMILAQKRVVIFMDYNANQTKVPYILDEFSQLWETPFSPQNRSFPCNQQRPPNLSNEDAEQRMYMANHNLNTNISLAGLSLLVPTTSLINETNSVEGFGSLGLTANDCSNFYNLGNFPGSVFEVAAQHNNVTYNRPCCGKRQSSAASKLSLHASIAKLGALLAACMLLI